MLSSMAFSTFCIFSLAILISLPNFSLAAGASLEEKLEFSIEEGKAFFSDSLRRKAPGMQNGHFAL